MILPVTMVGSWPRPKELLRAQKLKRRGQLDEASFEQLAEASILEILKLQEQAGIDIVTDGEQRRDSYSSFIAEKLEGVRMYTLAELMEVMTDRASFEMVLQALDVPAFSISQAICVGTIARKKPLAAHEARFLKQHTKLQVKTALPGPYLMTRSLWLKELSRAAYANKEELGDTVVKILREEVLELKDAGADFIQFDEPVLTELVFTQGQTRTFMCGALAARKDPTEELELAVDLMNRVVEGIEGVRIGVHVCRGNWSNDESTLLAGSYHPLMKYLERMKVAQLVLEYATQRAGDLVRFEDKEIGLGVVNPRTETIESEDEIKRSVERALSLFPADKIFLNPDCGFATFSARPMNLSEIAVQKMSAVVRVARAVASLR